MPNRLLRIAPYAMLAASICLTAMLHLAPRPNRPIAAVFPLWWSPTRTFAAAAESGGDIVRLGALSSILVMAPHPSDAVATTLAQRLTAAGAWLLLDAVALGACTTTSEVE